jgi:hypothetical protein
VFVERVSLVVEDRIQRGQVAWLWAKPGIDVLWLDVDDSAVMPCSGYLWLRLVRDRCDAVEVRMHVGRAGPV